MNQVMDSYHLALCLIEASEKIDIVIHKRPDGDALGALSSMISVLKYLGKNVNGICIDEIPKKYQFLSNLENLQKNFRSVSDLIISLDCASPDMAGIKYPKNKAAIINIDHHATNLFFGQINIVEPDSAATCQILYKLFKKMKVKFNRKIASSLFVGIYTDTGRFQHNNTHKQTLEIASRLLSFGVDIAKISKLIYHDKSINQLKLWGLILSRIKYYHQLGMVVSYVSKKDLIDFDIGREALEGISNFLATIPDAKVAMLLQEEDNVIKGSLRTEHNQYDVSKIASAFGGGGHKRAAGFEIPKKNHQNSNLLEMIDLAKIKKYLLT